MGLEHPLDVANLPTDLFVYHTASAATFCSSPALLFGGSEGAVGAHVLSTVPLQVANHSFLQFSLATACGSSPSGEFTISVEYADGETWLPLLPKACNPIADASCAPWSAVGSSVLLASDYSDGWHRITFPLEPAPARRFRLVAAATSTAIARTWAVANLTIGAFCPLREGAPCGGFGQCVQGKCICDPATQPAQDGTCEPGAGLASFTENFSAGLDASIWQPWPTGATARTPVCGELASGNLLYFSGLGTRRLVSLPLNTTLAQYLTFVIQLGDTSTFSGCDDIDSASEGVMLAYSRNNGASWSPVEYYDNSNQYRSALEVTVPLTAPMRGAGVLLMFWQPVRNFAADADVWMLDAIHLGPRFEAATEVLLDAHHSIAEGSFALVTHAPSTGFCGQSAAALFGTGAGLNMVVETVPLTLPSVAFAQFDLSLGCTDPAVAFTVALEVSDNLGRTWSELLPPQCNPMTSSSCTTWTGFTGSRYLDDDFVGWSRIVIPLREQPAGRRFRWRSTAVTSSLQRSFALDNVYIGGGCSASGGLGCGHHGRCVNSTGCICDAGFELVGEEGLCRPVAMVTGLRESFAATALSPQWWARVRGGSVRVSECGVVADGLALHMEGPSSRFAETVDLDLRLVRDLQFVVRVGDESTFSGCGNPTANREEVILAYSNDTGITWTLFDSLDTTNNRDGTWYRRALPAVLRVAGVRFLFFQPSHGPSETEDEWAIDDIGLIPVPEPLPSELYLPLNQSLGNDTSYTFAPNGRIASFCGEPSLLLTSSDTVPLKFLELAMLATPENAFFQMEVATGCIGDAVTERTLTVGFTTTSANVAEAVSSCLPQDGSSCLAWSGYGGSRFSSNDFTRGFARVAVPLTADASGRRYVVYTPFRDEAVSFAVKHIYVGNRCEFDCRGGGRCTLDGCVCDAGFARSADGRACVRTRTPLEELKEDFNDDLFSFRWRRFWNGGLQVGNACGTLVSGNSYRFEGTGTRVLETADLDLRDARFLQFVVQLGRSPSSSACPTPSSSEGMTVAYSTTFGRSWTLLRYISSGTSPAFELLTLPGDAKTENTRFLFWQARHDTFTSASDMISLDDVYIGPPSNVSATVLQDDFDAIDETQFLSIAGGSVRSLCQSRGNALFLDESESPQLRVTTQELNLSPELVVVVNGSDPLAPPPRVGVVFPSITGATERSACGLNNALVFDRATATRVLETADLDVTSTGLKLTYTFSFGVQGCNAPLASELVVLEYSVNAGVNWVSLTNLPTGGPQSRSLGLDAFPAMRTARTRFRWRQVAFTTAEDGFDVWAIRDVDISGIPQQEYFVQFRTAIGCTRSATQPLAVATSLNGISFTNVASCLPTASSCSQFQLPGGQIYPKSAPVWRRFTASLGITLGTNVRVRWLQTQPGSYGLDDIYVGAGCPSMCNNRGSCQANGACVCDPGWRGTACEDATNFTRTALVESFASTLLDSSVWQAVTGTVQTQSSCFPTASLVFDDRTTSHEALTQPFDVRGLTTFAFEWSACTGSTNSRVDLSLSCSADGVTFWRMLLKSSQRQGDTAMENITIPSECIGSATVFRFWSDVTGNNFRWAIDNIRMGGLCLINASACPAGRFCRDVAGGAGFECVCPPGTVADGDIECTVGRSFGGLCLGEGLSRT